MDPRQLSRLQEEQVKAIAETDNRIEQCQKFKSDYKALQERLNTLPDSVTHEIMVPFGKLGFMPGQMVHTNEILVLLGDNWFAERSAKQAGDIAGRRIKELDKQIKELKEQRKLLAPRLGFTSELQAQLEGDKDVKEIVEEYNEEKEKLWDEQHKKNVQKYRADLQSKDEVLRAPGDQPQSSKVEPSRPVTDEELWSRLDELERLEDQQGDLDSSEDEDEEGEQTKIGPSTTATDSRVRWADEKAVVASQRSGTTDNTDDDDDEEVDDDDDDGDDEEEEAESDDDDEEIERKPVKRITFSHSKTAPYAPLDSKPSDPSSITSPADIYKLYCPKSILKTKSEKVEERSNQRSKVRMTKTQRDNEAGRISAAGDAKVTPASSSAKTAFSGQIVERAAAPQESKPAASVVTDEPPKRVSRFKAQRMGQKLS